MTDDPQPPPEVDRAVIVGMRGLVQNALLVGDHTVGEASGRAWGFCYARYPYLPSAVIEAAVSFVLMELQLLPPLPLTAEINGVAFREVGDTALAQTIGYMIAFDERGKPHRAWHDGANSMAARHLVQHLRTRGFVVMSPEVDRRTHKGGASHPGPLERE
ncbi:MAG: hypothetical protein JWO24_4183 [Rhodospirillales bacterium]|nr:hypothetical protein [Rhodospirillales bacterium]